LSSLPGVSPYSVGARNLSNPTNPSNLSMAPRLVVYIGGGSGVFVPCWDVEIDQTAYGTADTFKCTTYIADQAFDYGLLSQATGNPIQIQVFAATGQTPSSSSTSYNERAMSRVWYGFLDEIEFRYHEDTMEIRGRGVLALLVDARSSSRSGLNQTITQVLTQLITEQGLTANVQPSSILAGKVLQDDYSFTARNVRTLEYMQALCDSVGWNIRSQWVGQYPTIICGPPPDPSQVPILYHTWGGPQGGTSLIIRHNALHSHNIKVRVISYTPKTKTQAKSEQVVDLLTGETTIIPLVSKGTQPTGNVTTVGRQKGDASGQFKFSQTEEYVFHVKDVKADDAALKAQQILKYISQHEFIAEYTYMPNPDEIKILAANSPEIIISIDGLSQSSGCGFYHPKRVRWMWNMDEGLRMNMLMANHSIPTNSGGI
jgi:hypothetical protein